MKKAQSSVIVAVVLVIISLILITVILTVILVKPSLLDYNKNYPQEQKIVVEKSNDYNNNRQPICYPPYRTFGLSCCLDSNYNGICDNDEIPKQTDNIEYCELPYIKIGTSCCLDDNRNGRCDLNDYGRYDDEYYERESAYLNSPFFLYDYSVGTDRITLYIKNEASETITLVDLEIDDCEKIDSGDTLAKNEKKRFSFDCDRDYNFDRDITITYQKEGSNGTRTSSGNIERDDRN
ncbi:MAG: hypothetical protein WC867_01225 [Candidatus Pacearchaeota archaeon]|jgi:hypothetical protein